MDCPIWPELDLGELSQELLGRLGGLRYPFVGTFELTERCNLACIHCFVNQPAGSREAAERELTLAQVRCVLDQLADAGCLFLLFTGGELLLRPDFRDIWRYAKQRGMLVSLFTNGTLLTRRVADFLAEWRPTAIEITLYGATQETYERVTRVPGSYARCLRGIELLLERGLRLNLKTVLLKANRHELEAMRAYAEQVGVPYRFDGVLWPRLDGDQSPFAHRLSPHEIIALDQQDRERMREWQEAYSRAPGFVRPESLYACGAGHHGFHVDCSGKLSMCMMARRPAYDLRQGSFQEGWRFMETVRAEKRELNTVCRTCTVGVLCAQCPGWSQMVHGDNETPVEFVCELGRLRADQFHLSAP
jgi:radical SAM protein with 4Fe4S-binding SPASM domain